MNGTRDRVIPVAFGERMFALAHALKRIFGFDGGGHDNLDDFRATEVAQRFIDGRTADDHVGRCPIHACTLEG